MRLLLLDDETPTLDLMETIVDWPRYGITAIDRAQTVSCALQIARTTPPDLVICDLRLPGPDGLDFIAALRMEGNSCRIVILSAYASFADAQRALPLGVSDYWLKPVDEQQIEAWLMRHLPAPTPLPPHHWMIQKARDYILSHFQDNLSLDDIAQAVTASRGYFCSVFKKESGQSVWDYLTQIRMERARHLLRSTDWKTYQIAAEVGYDNPSYFSKQFKRLTGLAPLEYRFTRGQDSP